MELANLKEKRKRNKKKQSTFLVDRGKVDPLPSTPMKGKGLGTLVAVSSKGNQNPFSVTIVGVGDMYGENVPLRETSIGGS